MHSPMSTAQWEKRITPKKREREKEERMGLLSKQQAPGPASPPQTQSKEERKRRPGKGKEGGETERKQINVYIMRRMVNSRRKEN